MKKLPDCVLDGEQVGDNPFAFDCLELEGQDIRPKSAEDRYSTAQGVCGPTTAGIQVVKAYVTEAGKRKEFAAIKARKGEGVVFKLRSSQYKAGRPNSGGPHIKFKFTASATCEVLAQNGAKRSVSLAMEGAPGILVEVGNVTIPANFEVPKPQTLCEIRYLYFFKGGSLYQPVYLGPRPDQSKADDVSSLKEKASIVDDE
jgi:bifunctional non-homologous end joining protein LigD